jgi:hypothetical protein
MRRILRLLAIAIALAGAIDPAVAVSGATRPRLAVVALDPAARAAADARRRLVRDLSPSFEVTSSVTSDAAAAVVIGDRYPEEPLPGAPSMSTVTTPRPPGVRIDGPREVPAATAIHLEVDVDRGMTTGPATLVTASIGGLEAGRTSHRWTPGETRWHAPLDVVPLGEPPYVIRVAADTATADAVVDLRRVPMRVQFYDPRPSWATTFLRRALEADPRFRVAALSDTSPGIPVRTGGAVPITDPGLDAFDVVVAGGLDRLSAADGRALDRFMRERGGAVVLVPDQRIDSGPAQDLVSGFAIVERLVEQPAQLIVTPPSVSLQASELLLFRSLAAGAGVIARLPGNDASALPAIVSVPHGDGTLILSGAMDAWRFRAADGNAFDRFWQATIAGVALAVAPPIAIDVDPPVLRPGESGRVVVRVRAHGATAVSAAIDSGVPIRLLPQPALGVFRGTFTAKRDAGRSTLEVRTAGAAAASASRTVLVQRDAAPLGAIDSPSLSMLASSHHGIDVTPDRLADLERFLRTTVTAPRTIGIRHPMRSTWWILPFALCLSADWWLRRRRGLR